MRYGVEPRIPENQHVRHAAKLYLVSRLTENAARRAAQQKGFVS